jgi:C1A family cysteine protease
MKDIREKKLYGFSTQTLRKLCHSISNVRKSNTIYSFTILLAIVLIFAGAASILVQSASVANNLSLGQNNNQTPTLIMAPQNPAFINYINSVSAGTPVNELVPPPTLVGNYTFKNSSQQNGGLLTMPTNSLLQLPSSFDLRTYNKVTPVENQSPYLDCWAFATYGSLESNLMPNQQWNFSENNLLNKNGWSIPQPNGGGDSRVSTSYLTRWSGPVLASQDPYYNPTSPSGLPTQVHVQNVSYLQPRQNSTDNYNIKAAIYDTMTGVYANMYFNLSYLNPDGNGAYYYNVSGTPAPSNHAITIIGWNDNYPASNFAPLTPPGPGAFICKDSLGTSMGAQGYLYVSYYDVALGEGSNADLAIFTAEPTTNYDNVYQYDTLGWDSNLEENGQNYVWIGDIYNTSNNPVNNEYQYVDAIGTYIPVTNTNYTIEVSYNPTNNDPSSGSSTGDTTQGTITGPPGYYTIPLSTIAPGEYGLYPARMPSGCNFSVVLYLQTPGYPLIPVQTVINGYTNNATASPGESFVSENWPNWVDLDTQYGNGTTACLKAYTENNIIENGGFEQNMADWTSWTSGTTGTVMVVSNESHHGTNSLLLAKSGYTSGAFGVSTNMYNVTPGNYSLNFYLINNSNSAPGLVYVKLLAYNSQGSYLGGGQWSLASVMGLGNWVGNLWEPFETVCDLPAGTTQAKVTISVQGNVNLNFDDFELFRSDNILYLPN